MTNIPAGEAEGVQAQIKEFEGYLYSQLNDAEYVVAPMGPFGSRYILGTNDFNDYATWAAEKRRANPRTVFFVVVAITVPLSVVAYRNLTILADVALVVLSLPAAFYFIYLPWKHRKQEFLEKFPDAIPTSIKLRKVTHSE